MMKLVGDRPYPAVLRLPLVLTLFDVDVEWRLSFAGTFGGSSYWSYCSLGCLACAAAANAPRAAGSRC